MYALNKWQLGTTLSSSIWGPDSWWPSLYWGHQLAFILQMGVRISYWQIFSNCWVENRNFVLGAPRYVDFISCSEPVSWEIPQDLGGGAWGRRGLGREGDAAWYKNYSVYPSNSHFVQGNWFSHLEISSNTGRYPGPTESYSIMWAPTVVWYYWDIASLRRQLEVQNSHY